MDQRIAPKEYYSIGEVCSLTGLKPHVLRYWETQFPALRPTKNRAGNRVYRRKEIKLVHLLQHLLYNEKYTIEGANQKLIEMRREGGLRGRGHEVLPGGFLAGIKTELEELRELLSPPAAPEA